MRIQPIYSYNNIKSDYSFQKKEKETNTSSNSKSNPLSFGAKLEDYSYKASIFSSFPRQYRVTKKDLDDILNYRINNIASGNVIKYTTTGRFDIATKNLYKFGSCIIDDLQRINQNDSLTNKEIVTALKKTIAKEPKLIETYGWKKDQSIKTYKIKREYIEELIKRISKLDPDDFSFKNRDFADKFIDDIAHTVYERHAKDFEEYTKSIKSKLKYSEYEDIKHLDMKEEFEKLNPEQKNEIIKNYGDKNGNNFDTIARNFLADRGSQDIMGKNTYPLFETAILQTLPRFSSQNRDNRFKKNEFELEPVYRWLTINDMEKFLQQFKIGGQYSYPQSQSCSTNPIQAEIDYSDYQDDKNVKLRIHPKSQKTKSYEFKDVECNIKGRNNFDDYTSVKRTSEVIYPPNAKFKVLGVYKDYVFSEAEDDRIHRSSDNYKVIIDLQEI